MLEGIGVNKVNVNGPPLPPAGTELMDPIQTALQFKEAVVIFGVILAGCVMVITVCDVHKEASRAVNVKLPAHIPEPVTVAPVTTEAVAGVHV